jgi:uncharacterized membrane protein HdeD (DUF308 family)
MISGLLMIMWPDKMMEYLVMLIGALFVLSGIYGLVLYFLRKNILRSFVYLVVSAAGILLGLLLLLLPQLFINILMYIWGGLLVLAGFHQIVVLVLARKHSVVPYGFYALPALVVAVAGIVTIMHPGEMSNYTLIILGVVSLLYGINELIDWYKFRPSQAIEIQEETKPEEKAQVGC